LRAQNKCDRHDLTLIDCNRIPTPHDALIFARGFRVSAVFRDDDSALQTESTREHPNASAVSGNYIDAAFAFIIIIRFTIYYVSEY
jgi:hypothetical protein